jgi:hypothetical protein
LKVTACWRSKSKKGVTLSITETKYVAISEAVKLINYWLCVFHIKVKLPIVVKTDNIGAIFTSENALTGVLQGMWIPSFTLFENLSKMVLLKLDLFNLPKDADIFIKNFSHDLRVKHKKNVWAGAGNFSTG